MSINSESSKWPALIAAGLFLLVILPTLHLTRLMDVDELIHARAALEASRDGHWLPMTLEGRPWWEKPPLLPWAGAATMKVFGPQEWCLRIWPALAGAGCVYFLARLAWLLTGGTWAALAAVLFFACQPDLLFHSRFFTMDTWLVWCTLAALWNFTLGFHKGGGSGRLSRFWLAGLWLGLAAAVKSYFALAPLPVLAFILLRRRPEKTSPGRALLALAAPPLGVLACWLAVYTFAYGREFLIQEWRVNTFGRVVKNIAMDAGISNFLFYFLYTQTAVTTLLPLGLMLWLRQAFFAPRPALRPPQSALSLFLVVFSALWTLALLLIRTQHENYILPLNAALCLCLACFLSQAQGKGELGVLLAGAFLSFLAVLSRARMEILLPLGILAAPLLLLFRLDRKKWALAGEARALAAGLLLVAGLARAGFYFWRLPDPNRAVVDEVLAHPASRPDEVLLYQGHWTESLKFYSRYRIQPVTEETARPFKYALLAETPEGPRFFAAGVDERKKAP